MDAFPGIPPSEGSGLDLPTLIVPKQRSKMSPSSSLIPTFKKPPASSLTNSNFVFACKSADKENKSIDVVHDLNVSLVKKQIGEKLFTSSKKRKPNQVSESIEPFPTLGSKPSRLDLIDINQLTSFPFAHPQPSQNSGNKVKRQAGNRAKNNWGRPVTPFDQDESANLHSPLVIIEDYIHEPHTLQHSRKKKKVSVLDLKRAIQNQEISQQQTELSPIYSRIKYDQSSVGSWSTHDNYDKIDSVSLKPVKSLNSFSSKSSNPTSYTASPVTTNGIYNTNHGFSPLLKQVSDDMIYSTPSIAGSPKILRKKSNASNIPFGSDLYANLIFDQGSLSEMPKSSLYFSNADSSLKYCVICEKPLYDISSLIPSDKNFEEIVCSDCFFDYEELSNLVKQLPENQLLSRYDTSGTKSEVEDFDNHEDDLNLTFHDSTANDTIGDETTDNDINDTTDTIQTIIRSRLNTANGLIHDRPASQTEKQSAVFKILIKKLKEIQDTDMSSRTEITRNVSKKSILDLNSLFSNFKRDNASQTNIRENFIIKSLRAKLFGSKPQREI